MPLYEYECEACGHRFEVIQKFSDPPVEQCPKCGARVKKLLASPAIQFKGSGWYITDYAKKRSGAEGAKAEGGKAEGAKTEGGKTESDKTEGKADSSKGTEAGSKTSATTSSDSAAAKPSRN